MICIEAREENVNCHANERQIKFKNQPKAGEVGKHGGSALVQGVKDSVGFRLGSGGGGSSSNSSSIGGRSCWDDDLRIVERQTEVPETIVLCAAGAEPRRVQGGQRLLSGGWCGEGGEAKPQQLPPTLSVSLSHMLLQFGVTLSQRRDKGWTDLW